MSNDLVNKEFSELCMNNESLLKIYFNKERLIYSKYNEIICKVSFNNDTWNVRHYYLENEQYIYDETERQPNLKGVMRYIMSNSKNWQPIKTYINLHKII